ICVVKRLLIARPAASSFALLMRKPDDRRCKAVAIADCDVDRLRCAFSDCTLVLMTRAMIEGLLKVDSERPQWPFRRDRAAVRLGPVVLTGLSVPLGQP